MATASSTALRMEDRIPVDVLVVSPNANLRDELIEKLCLPRWRVSQANGGAEALTRLRELDGNDPVLLLDPVLPDLNAGEFHRIVRESLSAYADPDAQLANRATSCWNRVADTNFKKSGRCSEQGGSLHTEALRPSDERNNEPENGGVVRLRSMVGNSQPMLRTYCADAHGCSARALRSSLPEKAEPARI